MDDQEAWSRLTWATWAEAVRNLAPGPALSTARSWEELPRTWREVYARTGTALAKAGQGIVSPLPAVEQVRAWLRAHCWDHDVPGPFGTLWTREGPEPVSVAVLHDDGDMAATLGCLHRIAWAEKRSVLAIVMEMWLHASD